jgi:acyl transferase domain-containing protein
MAELHVTPAASCAVAIVGCSGRFPGAADVPAFWKNLCDGVESVRRFTDRELEDAFGPDVRARPEFVKARSVLDGVADFDAGFFGMHAREAELTDPQHRLFLECSWEALEDAGCDPASFGGSIGVVAGCSIGSYLLRNVLGERAAIDRFTTDYQVGSYPELIGSGYDFLATRVAYKFNLRGPAMTLQSACSTSLLAVTQAAQALMLGQADVMLAGGVSVSFPQRRGYLYQDGGMASADARCRTFDANADGTVFGDGAGVVVLKRLEDRRAPWQPRTRWPAWPPRKSGSSSATAPVRRLATPLSSRPSLACSTQTRTAGRRACSARSRPTSDTSTSHPASRASSRRRWRSSGA